MKQHSYCFQKNNIWYFKKRIPYNLNSNNLIFKSSLKRLLGKKVYYSSLLNSTLFTITNYINNNLELLFLNKESITLEEIRKYIINLMNKYKDEATISDNDFVNNFLSTTEEIEEKRFEALSYIDSSGIKYEGYTLPALKKESLELKKAYDTKEYVLNRTKAKHILDRQNILTQEELSKIPEELRFEFEKMLVKIELGVIQQDIDNYKELHNIDDSIYDSISINSENEISNNNPLSDDWDILIKKYIDGQKQKGRNVRTAEIALQQFKEIMLGDENLMIIIGEQKLNIKRKTILNCSLEDINELKEIFKNFTKLNKPFLKQMWAAEGILNTINYTKDDRELYPKNLLSGIKVKIKIIIQFLKDIKLYDIDNYKDINIELWERLHIKFDELSAEDQKYNLENRKLTLFSDDLSYFLSQRYSNPKNAKRLFINHTVKSAHSFWSVALGIFTGARSEELAQLNIINDIHKETVDNEEIYYIYFHISDTNKQSLKNLASERITPISKYLIDLGFLNYVQSRIDNHNEYLFDLKLNKDLKRKEFSRTFNENFAKWFNEQYPEKIGRPPTFHSLRSHFVSKYLKDDEDNNKKLINLKKLSIMGLISK